MDGGFAAVSALVATAVSGSVMLLGDGSPSVPHAAALGGLISAILVPLMLPRVGATLRRVLGPIEPRPLARHGDAGDVYTEAMMELARKNARLSRELGELRSAYAELAVSAAENAQVAERLRYFAYHDALTALPNRVLLMERLERAMIDARSRNTGVLVFYLDLDNFKTINDTLGHSAGDRVLGEIGARIANCLSANDTASRVGGDEFVLVCPTSDAARDAAQMRRRLQRVFDAPVNLEGIPVTTGASIGTSVFPIDGSDPAALIHHADKAMYGAKVRGRDGRPSKRASAIRSR